MNYWVMTDFHLGHKDKMVKWCGRPENYEDILLHSLAGIPDEDVLIFLGDFCIGNDEFWHETHLRYKRTNILVKGNHDSKSDSWYYKHGWSAVVESFTLKRFGKTILFSHKPQRDSGYDLNIHGHIHEATKLRYEQDVEDAKNDKQILIKPEQYKALSLKKICNQ